MSKGIAKRRRIKRALEAARGNLHKIANGKALPLNNLPETPKPQDTEKLPASLRKMLALKELAAKQDKKDHTSGTGAGAAAPPKAKGRKDRKGQQQQQQETGGDDGPSTSGRKEAVVHERQRSQADGGVKGSNAFSEQSVQKKLKDKKKDYLKRKAEKKRTNGAGSNVVVEKELQLRDHVKFGEVVHAPLNVHLKRKHWADKEKTANERCKEVFLKQMQQAQQRMAGQATDEGIAVRSGKKLDADGGGAGPSKAKKRKAPPDAETEELRLKAIETYRAAKKGGGFRNMAVGNATLSSLANLVGKSGGVKATAGKTHTLA